MFTVQSSLKVLNTCDVCVCPFSGVIIAWYIFLGDPGKNLHDMMKEYESANRVRFEVYKVFILIPKSLKCFESVKNGSNLMEMRSVNIKFSSDMQREAGI